MSRYWAGSRASVTASLASTRGNGYEHLSMAIDPAFTRPAWDAKTPAVPHSGHGRAGDDRHWQAYRSKSFASAQQSLPATRSSRPRTNGKSKRFTKTSL